MPPELQENFEIVMILFEGYFVGHMCVTCPWSVSCEFGGIFVGYLSITASVTRKFRNMCNISF